MPEFFKRFSEQIKNFWGKLNKQQKIILISSLSIFFISTTIILILANRPNYVPLFTNLTTEDAALTVNKLKDLKIEYKFAADGTAILVPKEVVHATRLQLASEGLPRGGVVGFELFDKTQWNITDFTQRLNYQRALQGELARTISQLNEVEAARVHIVIPEERLYVEKEKEPTASVVLRLKPLTNLKEKQVRGIVNLVAHSVEGLKAENVEVLDTSGNILTELLEKDSSQEKITLVQMEAQKSYEKEQERRLTSMLEKVLGPQKAISRVSAELDFSKKDIQSEIYYPVVDKEGIPRSQESEEERFKGTGVAPGGIPGVSANVPGYPVVASGQSQYDRRRQTTNYEISKVTTHEVPAPGVVKRLSVAVIVDNKNLTTRRIQDIREVAAVACGLVFERGDKVAVVSMPFSTEIADRERTLIQDEVRKKITLFGGALLLTLFLLMTVYLSLRPRKEIIETFGPIETLPIQKLEEKKEVETQSIASVQVDEKKDEESDLEKTMSEEEKRRQKINQSLWEIEKILREKPENIVTAMRSWLIED